jgi:hypothetical protein
MCDGTICKCDTVLSEIGCNDDDFLVCQVCKRSVEVTVCDTSNNGFVCDNDMCRDVMRMVSDKLDNDVLETPSRYFEIAVAKNPNTGVFEVQTANGPCPLFTPSHIAFMAMAQYGMLTHPEHKRIVKMCLHDPVNMGFDNPVNTIYMRFSKPLNNIMCDDGIMRTTCHKWHIQSLRGSTMAMCQPVPIQVEGRHYITMEFTRMVSMGNENMS